MRVRLASRTTADAAIRHARPAPFSVSIARAAVLASLAGLYRSRTGTDRQALREVDRFLYLDGQATLTSCSLAWCNHPVIPVGTLRGGRRLCDIGDVARTFAMLSLPSATTRMARRLVKICGLPSDPVTFRRRPCPHLLTGIVGCGTTAI